MGMTRRNQGHQYQSMLNGSLLCVGIIMLALMLAGCSKKKEAEPELLPVVVTSVIQKDVPIYNTWVGSLDGNVNATIRPQVEGYLIKQNYREGDVVKKGQVLFEIDPRTFQTALDQAKGELDRNAAHYQQAKANLARIKPLAAQNAVSQKDLDDAIASELSAKANVESAQAEVSRAKLNLGFTKITSPIDGIAGLAKAQIGNLVGPSQVQELTTVSAVDPIKAYISISEQEYLWVVEHRQDKVAANKTEMILADGSIYAHQGTFALADRQVDPATGTIKIGALFPNPGNTMRPGQFAKVRVLVKMRQAALLVPQRSVNELQGTYQVAVVNPDDTVDIRTVKPADRIDNLWVIEEGLKAGERVVAEGFQKVKQGMKIKPLAYHAPSTNTSDASAQTTPAPAAQTSTK